MSSPSPSAEGPPMRCYCPYEAKGAGRGRVVLAGDVNAATPA
jgi:hypothetical protein